VAKSTLSSPCAYRRRPYVFPHPLMRLDASPLDWPCVSWDAAGVSPGPLGTPGDVSGGRLLSCGTSTCGRHLAHDAWPGGVDRARWRSGPGPSVPRGTGHTGHPIHVGVLERGARVRTEPEPACPQVSTTGRGAWPPWAPRDRTANDPTRNRPPTGFLRRLKDAPKYTLSGGETTVASGHNTLDGRRHTTRRGKEWSPTQVARVLKRARLAE
jgi:hypothetical protein